MEDVPDESHRATLTALAAVGDLLERARAAGGVMEACARTSADAAEIRRDAIQGLIDAGYRRGQLASELGLAAPRITQILRDTSLGVERRFLDPGPLTVVVGGKHASEKPEPVVSADSLAAWETLRAMALLYRRQASYEVVPPPGHELRLNRPGLAVLGSPRLLPFAGQLVDADPHHGWEEQEDGWCVVDRASGRRYRSELASDARTDYAYVGRLARPDGRGTWLYLAGIHGPGTRGAAQWLAEHVTDVYRAARTGRFSVLLAVRTDPKLRKIADTEAITEIRVPEGVK